MAGINKIGTSLCIVVDDMTDRTRRMTNPDARIHKGCSKTKEYFEFSPHRIQFGYVV